MKPKYKRLITIIAVLISVTSGTLYLLRSFSDNLIYFYTPTQVIKLNNQNPEKALLVFQKKIRVGGMVEKNSIEVSDDDKYVFIVTDGNFNAKINYKGILPPMFREGQGIVAEGNFEGIEDDMVFFKATTLVTKHDENYMPPELSGMKKKAE